MKKILGLTLGLFAGLFLLSSASQASVGVRAPKKTFVNSYSTNITSVSFTTTLTTMTEPGAVYQLIMSTGASGEYVILWDTNNVTGLSVTGAALSAQLGPRFFYGGTTSSTTIYTFDPPMIFYNGLFIGDSAASGQCSVTYENGRGLTGQ